MILSKKAFSYFQKIWSFYYVLWFYIWTVEDSDHSWLINGFVTRVTRRVPLVEQKLLVLPDHLSSHSVFSGVRVNRSLVLCAMFCRSLFVPLSYCLAIVLSVLLRCMDFDYSFGIFKLFFMHISTSNHSMVSDKIL